MRLFCSRLLILAALPPLARGMADEKASEKKPVAPEISPAEPGVPEKTNSSVEMIIHRVHPIPETGGALLILGTKDKETFLPVFIGRMEAEAIFRETAGFKPPRPMTHDLLKDLITKLGGEVRRITITKLENDIFFAEIVIKVNGADMNIDARPSDSMALAVRVNVPIFVEKSVLEKAGRKGPPESMLEGPEEKPEPKKPQEFPTDAI